MKTAVQRSAFSGVSVSAVLTAWITGVGLSTGCNGYLVKTWGEMQEARDRRAASAIMKLSTVRAVLARRLRGAGLWLQGWQFQVPGLAG